MNNKGMTLGVEILIIALFALLAFFTLYMGTNSLGLNFKNNFVDYKKIEEKLEKSAREYLSDKNITEKTIITADTLKSLDLFDSNCNGYVIVNGNYYDSYIKCSDYKTPGYTDVLAN